MSLVAGFKQQTPTVDRGLLWACFSNWGSHVKSSAARRVPNTELSPTAPQSGSGSQPSNGRFGRMAQDWPRPFHLHPRGSNTHPERPAALVLLRSKETSAPFNAENGDKEALGASRCRDQRAPTLGLLSSQTNPSSRQGRKSAGQGSGSSSDAPARLEAAPGRGGPWLPRGSSRARRTRGPRHGARGSPSRRLGGTRLRSRPAPRHLQDRGPLLPWPPPEPAPPLCGQARGSRAVGAAVGRAAAAGRYLWRAPRWNCRCRWCRECPRSGSAPWR